MKDIDYGINQLHEYRKLNKKENIKRKSNRSDYIFFITTMILFEVFIFVCALLTRR